MNFNISVKITYSKNEFILIPGYSQSTFHIHHRHGMNEVSYLRCSTNLESNVEITVCQMFHQTQ